MIGNPRVVRMLFDILNEKLDDVDIALQTIFVVHRLLCHPGSREAVIAHDRLTALILDLTLDPEVLVRQLANLCLDIVNEYDSSWRERIILKR